MYIHDEEYSKGLVCFSKDDCPVLEQDFSVPRPWHTWSKDREGELKKNAS